MADILGKNAKTKSLHRQKMLQVHRSKQAAVVTVVVNASRQKMAELAKGKSSNRIKAIVEATATKGQGGNCAPEDCAADGSLR
ncbi:hypothetical protein BGZ80_003052 [Entomortierella chlamydospora]|uniref:Uncharacterized protein n=1 Tax=Entomortierella chlamydospora TaxID=101097 RepID=A0A9P6MNX2_9FUNG|nr:hypothetical protein BGZ80_003052 [Entomortierella chlamydospora]